ncbi:MAG: phosphoribosylaminoimidazolesuccinocarboxamide synthase [Tissierellia bacterium]|nr:phosphoribosylaminoimidazolesuccinocarboxamide synthase [Tissierellia bacterium]
MNLIYEGKTKDVYALENGNVLLKFKDDVTGKDGVFDPGENQIGLRIEGIGNENLKVSKFFFDELRKRGVKTHYVNSNLENGEMEVLACQAFGKGIEVIFRNFAVGSFIRRYGLYAQEMMPLEDYVEVTLKDDERKDPLITEDALLQLEITTKEEYDSLKKQTILISNIITDILKSKGLDLIDIKLEYGKTKDGEVVLIDELSSGNMRVYRDGEKLDPQTLSKLILQA